MAAPSKAGISGIAALTGAIALWLVYAGVRDVPVFEGLRQVLRAERPTPSRTHSPFDPTINTGAGAVAGASLVNAGGAIAKGDRGIDRLVGNAASAYPVLKARFPSLAMHGWRATGSVPGSDHPKGLAIDVMTANAFVHVQVILAFRGLPGAKYWISRGQRAQAPQWAIEPYTGPSPHTDHVHLSFS
jgi:hypothetical protein